MKRMTLLVLTGLALGVGLVAAQPSTNVVPANKALLIIRVPHADATVKIDGFVSTQRGNERQFLTPELTAGFTYSYKVVAGWTHEGKEVSQARAVSFKVGELVNVDFRQVIGGDKVAKPLPIGTKEKKLVGKERSFHFTYAGKVKGLAPGQEASVWLPVARSGPEQVVSIVTQSLPVEGKTYTEKQYGNTSLFFKAKANDMGEIPFEVVYKVQRKEVVTDLKANLVLKPAKNENLSRFLEPDVKGPISGKPLELLKDKKISNDQFAAAKVLYEVVNTHMTYSKEGKGWGQGDSVWACDSKFGNCSDFHALFISMARGNKIPSKFEMGFPIPTKRGEGVVGGYHCWAWFLPDKAGWVPVDISEANRNPDMKDYYFGNLTEDRVRFTTGRDINLEPRQKGAALNFFIYPYVEVDGKTHPQEKIERRFAYQDVK